MLSLRRKQIHITKRAQLLINFPGTCAVYIKASLSIDKCRLTLNLLRLSEEHKQHEQSKARLHFCIDILQPV